MDTRRSLQFSLETWNIPYPMEGSLVGVIGKTWPTVGDQTLFQLVMRDQPFYNQLLNYFY